MLIRRADFPGRAGAAAIGGRRACRAFTLVELLIAISVLAALLSIAVPSYQQYQLRVKIATAASDISTLQGRVERFYIAHNRFPDSLDEAGMAGMTDPWNNSYQYLNITDAKNASKARKNKNLVPINSDYDLYSKGADGDSVPPLTASKSRDDIVRANNGAFVGLASDY